MLLSEQEKYTIVMNIRRLAKNRAFNILRGNKSQEWKNKLLDLIDDEVVYNHLVCMHPFQLRKYNSGVAVFEINYYLHNIYIKVNTKTQEVLSFHYDEKKTANTMSTVISTEAEDGVMLHCIPEKMGLDSHTFRFAIGSAVREPVMYSEYKDSIFLVATTDYVGMVKEMLTYQSRYLTKILGSRVISSDRESLKYFEQDLLSVTNSSVKSISLALNIYQAFPEDIELRRALIDFLIVQPQKNLTLFAQQLHNSMRPFPSFKEIEDFEDGDYDEDFTSEEKEIKQKALNEVKKLSVLTTNEFQ